MKAWMGAVIGVIAIVPPAALAADGENRSGPVERAYDVGDLLEPPPIHGLLWGGGRGSIVYRSKYMRGGGMSSGTVTVGGGEAPGISVADLFNSGVLSRLPGWDEGGPFRMEDGRLVIVQPAAVQARVADLLDRLRAVVLPRVAIEALFVPPAALEEVLPGWAAKGPAVPGDAYARLLADPRARLLTAIAQNGQQVGTGRGERGVFLSDYEVNQTGVIPVLNPVPELLAAGDGFEVLPRIAPGGKTVRLELFIGESALGSRTEKISAYFGDFQFPRYDEGSSWSTVHVRSGGAAIAGMVAGGPAGEGGCAFIVRATILSGGVVAPPPPAGQPSEPKVGVYPLPLRLVPMRDCDGHDGVVASAEGTSSNEAITFAPKGPEKRDPEEALEILRNDLVEKAANVLGEGDTVTWLLRDSKVLVAAGSERFQKLVEDTLRSRDGPEGMAAIDLRLLRFPRAAIAALTAQMEAEGVLKAGWEAAVPPEGVELRSLLVGAPGQTVADRRDRTEQAVTDIELVSGGTGFSLVEVVDPVGEKLSSGFAFEASAREVPGAAGALELSCRGVIGSTDLSSRQTAGIPFYTESPTGAVPPAGGEAKPAPGSHRAGSQDHLEVKLATPSQQIRQVRARLRVPPGRDAVLDLAASGEKLLVLVGSARIAAP